MKRKIYLICYAVFQVVASIYSMLNVNSIAKATVESTNEMLATMPKEFQTMFSEVNTVEMMSSSIMITAVATFILGAILLWLFVRDKVSVKKGLAITLTVISLLLGLNVLVSILSFIALILVATVEKVAVVKEKKEISRLKDLKVNGKDLIWVLVLVLAYFTQFVVPIFIDNVVVGIIYEILFYVLIFALVLYVFRKRLKRDFREFKKNFKVYIGYIFKWWGIMLFLVFVTGILRALLGGELETANQANLNSLPLWFVGPVAIIWAPFVEEGIFRLGLRRFVKNDKLFIVLSALLFGLLHTISSETGVYNMLIQSLSYAAMGGVMAHVYTKTNNSFVNMGIHCIQNTLGILMIVFTQLI